MPRQCRWSVEDRLPPLAGKEVTRTTVRLRELSKRSVRNHRPSSTSNAFLFGHSDCLRLPCRINVVTALQHPRDQCRNAHRPVTTPIDNPAPPAHLILHSINMLLIDAAAPPCLLLFSTSSSSSWCYSPSSLIASSSAPPCRPSPRAASPSCRAAGSWHTTTDARAWAGSVN